LFLETNAGKIYDDTIAELESLCKEVLRPGDERRIFGDALSSVFVAIRNAVNDSAKQKMLRYARGMILDALGERTGTERLPARRATGKVYFSADVRVDSSITIPQGTKVMSYDRQYFRTTEVGVLPAGGATVEVDIEAVEAGSGANGFEWGEINIMVDRVLGIATIYNTSTTSGGDDGEPYDAAGDAHYKERIRLAGSAAPGTEDGYKYWAMSADPAVIDASVTVPSDGTVLIMPLCEGGTLPTWDILSKVLASCTESSHKGLTDQVQVAGPSSHEYSIDIRYYVDEAHAVAAMEAVEGENGAIAQYAAWQCTGIGRDINPDKLRALVLSVEGVYRLDIASPAHDTVNEDAVAQLSGMSVECERT